jgi:hypothetical protein
MRGLCFGITLLQSIPALRNHINARESVTEALQIFQRMSIMG